ncbi:error-prone DNA polymerase [Sanguibacter gelidistatuariae]|uniref:Error-prone DNA polymerase n=1 Tax=Sanguibacter gelidistatuariae TaxID=1814289 RepID=A0A1G6TIE8_9MICO|nr:error-prone DNA polymerase [Sanguibacter gelidistatuariae]SDD28830.1 error-prone DNA polymerase [Sanguibacter gelidistatuariae]
MTEAPAYAELHAHSAFSFLDGASQPEEMVAEAVRLGLSALAITDHDGLYGVVRFAEAARDAGLATIFGAELHLPTSDGVLDPPTGTPDPQSAHLVVLARGPQGYRNLSAAIADAHLETGQKGAASYTLDRLGEQSAGQWLVLTGCRKGAVRRALGGQRRGPAGQQWDLAGARHELDRLVATFGHDNVAVEITDSGDPYDSERNDHLADLARAANLPLVATTAAHYARPQDGDLAAALAAIRARSSLDEIAGWLPAAPAAHLRSGAEMVLRHSLHREAVATAAALGEECVFDLALVAPNLPPYKVPAGHTEATWLRELVREGAYQRYGPRDRETEAGAYAQIDRELRIIEDLDFPGYFLIVYDLVEFCRVNGILAQGRGSAANSAVCYALGITAVDAVKHNLLFERFLAPERDGPPDIDVDIESGRREEVIQHVYETFGRRHAAQVANVISYRPRSAIRDAARALGYDVGQQDAWSKHIERWGSLRPQPATDAAPVDPVPERVVDPLASTADDERADSANSATTSRTARQDRSQAREGMWHKGPVVEQDDTQDIPAPVIDLAERLLHLPRHLGIHSGGMVLCDRPVVEVCPVEWARMPGRTVLQWDKEDCADAGLVKFDLLGLGMLTALRIAFEQVREHEGIELTLHGLPQEDPAVYDLLCAADTIGVFQVESRAQISTLPRLRPEKFYDIVIEVALIRPGPIQGNSVHPYIERKRGRQDVTYLHPSLEKSLARTLGVPLFQEQLMQMAIDVADFTPAEADQLRRAMGSKRSVERMEAMHERLLDGMAAKGIDRDTGEEIFGKLKGFADFGFPESHAYSFAYLVYASAWLKVRHPAAFYAGLLAAQPMGFYSPQSLVADARRRGVTVLRPDINASGAQALVERVPDGLGGSGLGVLGVRLGLASVRSVADDVAQRLVAERAAGGPFADLRDLARRGSLTTVHLESLATAGAVDSLGVGRREALWAAGALAQERPDTLPGVSVGVSAPMLPGMSELEIAVADVWSTGVTVGSYPTEHVRPGLTAAGVLTVQECFTHEAERRVSVAGVVTHRQRPGTARGVTFISLEDETGQLNVVCSPGLWQRFRRVARTSAALVVRGRIERADNATNLVAEHMSALSLQVATSSRDFR